MTEETEEKKEIQSALNPDMPAPLPKSPEHPVKQDDDDKDVLLSKSKIRRILKHHGVSMVSDDALVEVQQFLNEILMDLSMKVIPLTKHRNAVICSREDVLLGITR